MVYFQNQEINLNDHWKQILLRNQNFFLSVLPGEHLSSFLSSILNFSTAVILLLWTASKLFVLNWHCFCFSLMCPTTQNLQVGSLVTLLSQHCVSYWFFLVVSNSISPFLHSLMPYSLQLHLAIGKGSSLLFPHR